MAIIYNFLNNVWRSLLSESKSNSSFLPLVLLLVSIPLKLGINNVFLAVFIVSVFISKPKLQSGISLTVLLPLLLFLWMCLSYFWTVDAAGTTSAIPKEIVLLLLPIAFLFLSITASQKLKAFQFYSYFIVLFATYYLGRAFVRYLITQDIQAFFYHGENEEDSGLVPKFLNAIHVSVFVAIAFFYFFTNETKSKFNTIFSLFLFAFLILLSSKNIISTVVLLTVIYLVFYSKIANKMRLRNLTILATILVLLFSVGKIKNRFQLEFQTNSEKSLSSNVIKGLPEGVKNISIMEAWNSKTFSPNDFFPGTAFRVYQARLFFEFLKEEPIFWTGFGLNASYQKLEEKGIKYNIFLGDDKNEGYQKKNFHNQYIQVFAELGVIGFVLFLLILIINTKNAFQSKDFMHIAFAILMISLFLTESFLWRQRGVVFFTLFYCLFNTNNYLPLRKN
jgi:O-antigen ligase